jgi:hypothetical protein
MAVGAIHPDKAKLVQNWMEDKRFVGLKIGDLMIFPPELP